MKKTLLIFLVLLGQNTIAQSIFYQAQWLDDVDTLRLENNLKDHFQSKIPENYSTQLNAIKYFKKNFKDNSDRKLNFEIVYKMLKEINYQNGERYVGGLIGIISPVSSILGSLSASKRDTITKGLALQIQEEFKRNQTETIMQGYRKTIGKYEDIKRLFPYTNEKFETMDWTRYKDYGVEFRTVFKKDLASFVDNTFALIDDTATGNEDSLLFLKDTVRVTIKQKQIYPAIRLFFDIGKKLNTGMQPLDVLAYMSEMSMPNYVNNATKKYYNKLHNVLNLSYHLQNAFRRDSSQGVSAEKQKNWVSLSDLKKIDTKNEQDYFVALLKRDIKGSFKDVFGKDIENYATLKEAYGLEFLEVLNSTDEFLQQKDKAIFLGDNFLNYSRMFIKIIKPFYKDSLSNNDLALLEKALSLANAIRTEDYSNTIYDMVSILKTIGSSDENFKRYASLLDYYGSFTTGIVNAKNSEDVRNVIKSLSDASGSHKEHQSIRNLFVLSISSYPGLFYGRDKDFISKDNNKSATSVWGLSAPIGLSLAIPIVCEGKSIGNIFIQRTDLDLAALFNYRAGNDKVSQLPVGKAIDFSSFITPGWSLGWTFKNTPLSLSVNYQKMSPLRDADATTPYDKLAYTRRWSLKLSYDIALLNIWKCRK